MKENAFKNQFGIFLVLSKTSMKRTGHKTFAAYSRYVDVNKESMTHANQKWDEMYSSLLKGVDAVPT